MLCTAQERWPRGTRTDPEPDDDERRPMAIGDSDNGGSRCKITDHLPAAFCCC
ncbi:hypothetical protein ZHAS_00016989 [Anopheles sinensis]|uniref:Uncharacterized protein n=1 Tax=Anopheles sinensis TaxID=74873 RepID=A0A084WFJ0_ANOSI|nr:hypothetical protein ZHAS_00016989 [Anopheles sinensis]